MAIDWQSVITSLGGQAVLLAAVAWLAKVLVSSRLSREADAFRIRLKADTDVEIERLRASLQIAAAEHHVLFSKLHEKRAEVIEKLYILLLEAADAAKTFAANPNDTQLGKEEWNQHLQLYRFFHINKIYLPSALCALLENYETKLRFSTTSVKIYMSIENPKPEIVNEQVKVVREAWRALETDLPAIMSELETEFRQLLGVEPAKEGSATAPRSRQQA
jgi:hypothetical protein